MTEKLNSLGQLRVLLQRLRPGGEGALHHLREVQRLLPCPPAQLVGAPHQHVHAVRTHEPHDHGAEKADDPPGVPEGVRHGEDASADVALQEVHHGVEVRGGVFEFPVEDGVFGTGGDVVQVYGGGLALLVAVEEALLLLVLVHGGLREDRLGLLEEVGVLAHKRSSRKVQYEKIDIDKRGNTG